MLFNNTSGTTFSFGSVEVTIKAPSEFAVKRGRYIWVLPKQYVYEAL
jgi:hypothetical protein